MPDKSDHDLLIEIHSAVFGELGLIKQFKNHLKHHWAITMTMLTAILGLIGALIIK